MAAPANQNTKEFFGHPAGLYVLFFTEMWERFSYYGMRSLLVLYMVNYLLVDSARAEAVIGYPLLLSVLTSLFGELNIQQISSQIYGIYTSLVYLTPLFGGLLADKYLGQHRTVYLGGLFFIVGHFLMAIESMFIVAMCFLFLGNGCFKPNISTQVGNCYPDNDPRRDRAYLIFYQGINLGAFLAPFICGTLGQNYGWHWGFGAAGVGMILGMIVYHFGNHLVPKEKSLVYADVNQVEKRKLTTKEWYAVFSVITFCMLALVFWAIYEQQGNTLQLWADERTAWPSPFGWNISTWYQSFNPIMIIAFVPLVNMFWAWQSRGGKEPSSVTKMGIGCFLCGAAYLVMLWAAAVVPEDQKASVMWLVATTFVFTMGEIYLSPIGLSLVTKVSPKPVVSTMMGFWFASSAIGNYLTGFLGMSYSKMSATNFFLMLFGLGVATGIVFLLMRNLIAKGIGKDV